MFAPLRYLLLTLPALSVTLLVACDGGGLQLPSGGPSKDAGSLADVQSPSDSRLVADQSQVPKDRGITIDQRAHHDRGFPTDRGVPEDQGVPADQGSLADVWAPRCTTAVIGRPCSQKSDCGFFSGVQCLKAVAGKSGVCSCSCTTDDPTTSYNEDTCPDKNQTICANVEQSNGITKPFCLKRCSPRIGSNSCAAPLACQLYAAPSVGIFEDFSVCLWEGCKTNSDCPVSTAKSCSAQAPCPAGQTCVDGFCAHPGHCDTASGLCGPRQAHFKASATVGSPCKSDLDCGKAMTCFKESTAQQRNEKPGGTTCTVDSDCCSGRCTNKLCTPGPCLTKFRNGYCTIGGCGLPTFLPGRCPTGSSCNRGYGAGLCQKTCQLGTPGSCRGFAGDRFGDYECRDWSRIQDLSGRPFSQGPVCDFGVAMSCEWFGSLGCQSVGDASNSTNMRCRDLNNVTLSTPSNFGFCLDDTASGPI